MFFFAGERFFCHPSEATIHIRHLDLWNLRPERCKNLLEPTKNRSVGGIRCKYNIYIYICFKKKSYYIIYIYILELGMISEHFVFECFWSTISQAPAKFTGREGDFLVPRILMSGSNPIWGARHSVFCFGVKRCLVDMSCCWCLVYPSLVHEKGIHFSSGVFQFGFTNFNNNPTPRSLPIQNRLLKKRYPSLMVWEACPSQLSWNSITLHAPSEIHHNYRRIEGSGHSYAAAWRIFASPSKSDFSTGILRSGQTLEKTNPNNVVLCMSQITQKLP